MSKICKYCGTENNLFINKHGINSICKKCRSDIISNSSKKSWITILIKMVNLIKDIGKG
jgi:hypothetical protein